MYNSNPPAQSDLPSTGKLIKSTVLAAFAAGLLLVTVVMPAEYGIDPTGIGKIIGLKKMGEIKTSLAKDAAAEAAKELAVAANPAPIAPVMTEPVMEPVIAEVPAPAAITSQSHEKIFTLAPDAWTEIKLKMDKGAKADFVWFTDGGRANFDTHADSKTLDIDYHNYAKGSKVRDEGILEAKFDGSHGWFWRNRSGKTMIVTLQTSGEYSDIIVMD
ncbi:MAG: transmembrane anchor protein [Robiginitomaculum sp.]|nr:MAG: transmembrane anchor protein [Robiginitomaculum sp.]